MNPNLPSSLPLRPIFLLAATLIASPAVPAQSGAETTGQRTGQHPGELLRILDPEARVSSNVVQVHTGAGPLRCPVWRRFRAPASGNLCNSRVEEALRRLLDPTT